MTDLEREEANIRAEFSPARAFDLLARIAAESALNRRTLEDLADGLLSATQRLGAAEAAAAEVPALRARVATLEAKAA